MGFDSLHELLELPIQGNCLRSQNKFMQVLPMVGLNCQARVHVLMNENIIENHKVC
jgi:hypothetical protein